VSALFSKDDDNGEVINAIGYLKMKNTLHGESDIRALLTHLSSKIVGPENYSLTEVSRWRLKESHASPFPLMVTLCAQAEATFNCPHCSIPPRAGSSTSATRRICASSIALQLSQTHQQISQPASTTTWLIKIKTNSTVLSTERACHFPQASRTFADSKKTIMVSESRAFHMRTKRVSNVYVKSPITYYPSEIEIEIEIVYNMCRQTGPTAVSLATQLRHTLLISKLGPGLSDQVHFLSTHLSAMCVDIPREL
jgi:hypothetical protein